MLKLLFKPSVLFALLLLHTQPARTATDNMNCQKMPYKELNNCCQFPQFNYATHVAECAQMLKQSSAADLTRNLHSCFIACIAQQHGLIDVDNNPQLSRIQAALGDFIPDQRFVQAYYRGISTCAPSVRAKIARRQKREQRRKQQRGKANDNTKLQLLRSNCSSVPMLYALCAHTEVFLNCPREAWLNSRECNATRKFVQSCIQNST